VLLHGGARCSKGEHRWCCSRRAAADECLPVRLVSAAPGCACGVHSSQIEAVQQQVTARESAGMRSSVCLLTKGGTAGPQPVGLYCTGRVPAGALYIVLLLTRRVAAGAALCHWFVSNPDGTSACSSWLFVKSCCSSCWPAAQYLGLLCHSLIGCVLPGRQAATAAGLVPRV
jgi:hypothetical protein